MQQYRSMRSFKRISIMTRDTNLDVIVHDIQYS